MIVHPSLVEVDDNNKSRLDITIDQAIPDELNPAHHIEYNKGHKVMREQHATPNVVISQVPAQPATQFMQKEYIARLASGEPQQPATPEELMKSHRTIIIERPINIQAQTENSIYDIDLVQYPVPVPRVLPCIKSKEVVEMEKEIIPPNYDINKWHFYMEDGSLPCDAFAHYDDYDLNFEQTLIKYQTKEFIESLNVDYNMLHIANDKIYILLDPEDGRGKVVVPPEMRLRLIQSVHQQRIHPGQNKTVQSIKQDYYWPHMTKDIKRYVQACEICQKAKNQRGYKYQFLKLPITARLKTLHIDIVGPVKRLRGKPVYLITMIDRFTRFVEAAVVREHKARTVKVVLYNSWISRYGPPVTLISDNGAEFRGHTFSNYLRFYGIQHKFTTPYHPQTNGMVERMHSTLKAMIRCHQLAKRDWVVHINTCLFALRTAINELGISPALALYGEALSIPGAFVNHEYTIKLDMSDIFIKEIQEEMKFIAEYILKFDPVLAGPKEENNMHFPWDTDWVMIKESPIQASVEAKYFGPYHVEDKTKMPVVIIWKDGKLHPINIMRLKPFYKLPDDIAEVCRQFDEEVEQFPQFRNTMKLTQPINNEKPLVNPPMIMLMNSEQYSFAPNQNHIFNEEAPTIHFDRLRRYAESSEREWPSEAIMTVPGTLQDGSIIIADEKDLIDLTAADDVIDQPALDEAVSDDKLSPPLQPDKVENELIDLNEQTTPVPILDTPNEDRVVHVELTPTTPTLQSTMITCPSPKAIDALSVKSLPDEVPATIQSDIRRRMQERVEPELAIRNRPTRNRKPTIRFQP